MKFVAAIKRFHRPGVPEMTPPVRIAGLSGAGISGIQHEIDTAAKEVGGEIFYPDVALKAYAVILISSGWM